MKTSIFLAAGILLLGCDDIITPDISNKVVNIRLPADGFSVSGGSTTSFWWDELPGATGYRFTLVAPNMTTPTELVVDSVITENKVKILLDSGHYEWCVSAVNNAYTSKEACRQLSITD